MGEGASARSGVTSDAAHDAPVQWVIGSAPSLTPTTLALPQDPVAIKCFVDGRTPAHRSSQHGSAPSPSLRQSSPCPWARARPGVLREAVRQHASALCRDPRRSQSLREKTTINCQRTIDRRAPRNSIVAQLGGVALLPERYPRHPVIGNWSGRSAG